MKPGRQRLLFAIFPLVMISSTQAQRGNPEIAFAGQSVDEIIAAFVRENDIPGLSMAIVQAPYITRIAGYGLGDVEKRLLVASNTLFDLGQISEAYLAVAVMQLVESGKLALNDPVSKHLTDLPDAWQQVTALQLIQHQSGVARNSGATDYELLARMIEKLSGQSAEAFIRANQFERLGLKNTLFASELGTLSWENPVPGQTHHAFLKQARLINPTEPATGYRASKDGLQPVTRGGSLRIFASSQDVSIWDIGLAGEILVKDPALRKILYHPPTHSDGTKIASSGPWYFPGHEGLMIATGSGEGFSSLLSRFTKSDELLCVTLLVNKEGVDLTQLARRIAGAYDVRLGPPPTTAKMRAQQSPVGVKETIDRLESILKARGISVMARLDHAKAAEAAGLTLRPTEALVFGNPANGTLLMQNNAAVATELPLRAAAWEENGAVWLAATDPLEIIDRNSLPDRRAEALKMRLGLDAALLQAVSGE